MELNKKLRGKFEAPDILKELKQCDALEKLIDDLQVETASVKSVKAAKRER